MPTCWGANGGCRAQAWRPRAVRYVAGTANQRKYCRSDHVELGRFTASNGRRFEDLAAAEGSQSRSATAPDSVWGQLRVVPTQSDFLVGIAELASTDWSSRASRVLHVEALRRGELSWITLRCLSRSCSAECLNIWSSIRASAGHRIACDKRAYNVQRAMRAVPAAPKLTSILELTGNCNSRRQEDACF